MGNKHSADITIPNVQSYTQHPDGAIWGAEHAPRRNSFNGCVPSTDYVVDRKKLAATKSLYIEHDRAFDRERHGQTLLPPEFKDGDARSRPGTNDSGYFTTCLTDSDKSERARLRGSRTSLNDTIFAGPPQLMRCGPPSPAFLPGHPAPDIVFGPPPPPLTRAECKKMKKWRKKQNQILSRHESLMHTLDPRMPPPFGLFPPPHLPLYRARSVDNLHMVSACPPPFLRHPAPPMTRGERGHRQQRQHEPRRFASQTDLRFVGGTPHPHFLFAPPPPQPQPPPLLEGKYDKRGRKLKESKKDGSLRGSSLLGASKTPSSRSGRTSRNNEETNTKFEEERIIKPNEGKLATKALSMEFESDTATDVLSSTTKSPPPDVIYETLKATRQQHRSTLLTTAEIEFEKNRETKENVLNISFENGADKREGFAQESQKQQQPVSVSAEAKAVIRRNEEILARAENAETACVAQKACSDLAKVEIEAKPKSVEIDKEPMDNKRSTPTATSSSDTSKSDDSTIEAVLNPILLKRKVAKPEGFEALRAWREIKIDAAETPSLAMADAGGCAISENIVVKLISVAPSRKDEQHTEPIYLEYDERLPDFKKRLIETGSFDFPEIEQFHHEQASQYSGSKTKDIGDDVGVATESRSRKMASNTESGKGSLKRLKDSVAQMFGGAGVRMGNDKTSSYTLNDPPTNGGGKLGQPHERSLTPTTAKIKAGDSSEIDFSWVHDLETRFRREREQFEREMESRKRQTLVPQRNGSSTLTRSTDNDVGCLRNTYSNSNGYSKTHETTLNDIHNRHYPDANDFASLQRSAAANNVRAKTAMFESEAQRLQREMDLKRQQMARQKRSSSTPIRSDFYDAAEEEPIYIPKPDYDYSNGVGSAAVEQNGRFHHQHQPNIANGCYQSSTRIPIGNGASVDFGASSHYRHGQQNSYDSSNYPRKLNRFYGDDGERVSIARNRYSLEPAMNGSQPVNQQHATNGGCKSRRDQLEYQPTNGPLSRMNGYENGFSKSDASNFPPHHYVSQPTLDRSRCDADFVANNGISYRQNLSRRAP